MNNFPPVGESTEKKARVESMFDAIAHRYDLLNRVLSFGIDQGWRKKAVDLIAPFRPTNILDVATGTADLALAAMRLQPESIVGVDLSEEMLEVGRRKIAEADLSDRIALQKGDAEDLGFADKTFDAALVAFGVRNFGDLRAGLKEIRRVLQPGTPLVVLEFSHPTAFPIKQGYAFYSKHILPRVGGMISRDDGAYRYLPESVAAFPDGERFMTVLRECGFVEPEWHRLTFGIASLYRAIA